MLRESLAGMCLVLLCGGCTAAVCATEWSTTVGVERYRGDVSPSAAVTVGGSLGKDRCELDTAEDPH